MTRRKLLVAYGLWIFGLVAYFLPGATWSPASRFALTRAVVEHRALSIDGFEDSTGDRARRGDHWYSDKAPIPSLFAVPAHVLTNAVLDVTRRPIHFESVGDDAERIRVNRSFQLALWICSLVTSGLASAAIAIVLFVALARRTTSFGAFACSTITVLATPLFPYGTSFYGHAPAALFLLAPLLVATSEAPSRRALRIAGAGVALAAGCEYLTLVPGLVIATFIVRRERRALVDLALGAAVPALFVAAYHTICFGAPWETGYGHLVRPRFVAGHARGVLGLHFPRVDVTFALLFGPRRGLFYIAPVTLVGVAGLVRGWQRGDRACVIAASAALTMLLLNAGYYMWWGGAATGPRHLVPVLPMLAFGFTRAWESARLRWLVTVLAIASFAIMLAFVAVGLEAPEHGNVLTTYVWPNIKRARIGGIPGASNIGLLAGLGPVASLVPIVGWTCAGTAWFGRRVR